MMVSSDIKKMDSWQYIEAWARDDNVRMAAIGNNIESKYKGTACAGNPYQYELELLADAIVKEKGYKGERKFLQELPENIALVAIRIGLDYLLMLRDQR